MKKALKVATKFAGERVKFVGSQSGTRYHSGRSDEELYFESESGKHVVVYVSGVDNTMTARKSDGVVW